MKGWVGGAILHMLVREELLDEMTTELRLKGDLKKYPWEGEPSHDNGSTL